MRRTEVFKKTDKEEFFYELNFDITGEEKEDILPVKTILKGIKLDNKLAFLVNDSKIIDKGGDISTYYTNSILLRSSFRVSGKQIVFGKSSNSGSWRYINFGWRYCTFCCDGSI